jgi:hypothetical protein
MVGGGNNRAGAWILAMCVTAVALKNVHVSTEINMYKKKQTCIRSCCRTNRCQSAQQHASNSTGR